MLAYRAYSQLSNQFILPVTFILYQTAYPPLNELGRGRQLVSYLTQ